MSNVKDTYKIGQGYSLQELQTTLELSEKSSQHAFDTLYKMIMENSQDIGEMEFLEQVLSESVLSVAVLKMLLVEKERDFVKNN
ncbi:hypothetical protein [Fulvivirga sedimenti]|uniref:Uncharacterized protein n=1 Tax=Fulvivirga sedimenti TaxID=2879465 RepID=A0A9X1HVP7_9BACT|nr:hypothetical protein [Fulvivirga sedimenti]MCA6078810.1 hypothetical protein [Fulvivirga sedimenti]